MDQESIVYGCIKDIAFDTTCPDGARRRRINREVMLSLPGVEEWPLIPREMFSIPADIPLAPEYQTEVLHFGASYRAIEYEWSEWIAQFEALLAKMYWVSATVHLETELHGTHTFTWRSDNGYHSPDSGTLAIRCEWSREHSIL